MKIKKLIASVLAGASMLALAGVATATDLNLYGSSAQYLYWNAAAPNILQNSMSCTGIQQAKFNSKNAITTATCGTDTVYYRVSSKASFDGVEAMLGNDQYAAAGTTSEKCSPGDPGYPGTALEGYYRKMVDENSCTWGSITAPGTCTALKCVRVTLGLSDVAGVSFTQTSTGNQFGPLGGPAISRSFSGISTAGAGLTSYNPMVVPFAFFANSTVKKCVDATPTMYASCSSAANQQTITNMSRMQAIMIFSGQAWNWTDFGGDYVPSLPIVACLRHAGSGTHSTLDYAVMSSGKWGASLVNAQNATSPTVWFNDGSSDEVNCVQGSGTWTGAGAIGYCDADQATSATMVRLTYNGETPARVNIRNGRYDFWTTEWAYENKSVETTLQQQHVTAMMNYAALPNNIPTATYWGADKTGYWASSGEMNYMKSTDQVYPAYVGASHPQQP